MVLQNVCPRDPLSTLLHQKAASTGSSLPHFSCLPIRTLPEGGGQVTVRSGYFILPCWLCGLSVSIYWRPQLLSSGVSECQVHLSPSQAPSGVIVEMSYCTLFIPLAPAAPSEVVPLLNAVWITPSDCQISFLPRTLTDKSLSLQLPYLFLPFKSKLTWTPVLAS